MKQNNKAMNKEENNTIGEVFIVTTSCHVARRDGVPDENYGFNIRVVTTDFEKAYKCFKTWLRNIDGHMNRAGYREKHDSRYMDGDLYRWVTWERNNEIESTCVELKRYKVEN